MRWMRNSWGLGPVSMRGERLSVAPYAWRPSHPAVMDAL